MMQFRSNTDFQTFQIDSEMSLFSCYGQFLGNVTIQKHQGDSGRKQRWRIRSIFLFVRRFCKRNKSFKCHNILSHFVFWKPFRTILNICSNSLRRFKALLIFWTMSGDGRCSFMFSMEFNFRSYFLLFVPFSIKHYRMVDV